MRWQLLALAGAVLVVAALGAGLQAAATRSISGLTASTAVARQQGTAVRDVLEALQDAELGQRGYLLTLQPNFLEPFRSGTSRLEPALDRLETLARTTPWLQEADDALRSAATRRMDGLRSSLALAQDGQVAAALAIVTSGEGKALMDDVRRQVAAIATRAENERSALVGEVLGRQRTLNAATQAALALGVLSLGAALAVVLWNRAKLMRAQRLQGVLSARLEAAVERIRDGIGVWDGDGRLLLRNDRFAPALGLDPARGRLGMTWDNLVAETRLDPPILQAEVPGAAPVVMEAREGARTLEVWRSVMPDGGQMLAVADISRRVQAETIARQAQKMEVLGQMTGGVAHDFNNLLQVVSANLELVTGRLARGTPDAWLAARLDAARSGVVRGARLTRHLLAFARRQPLAPEPLEPARLLTGMEDMLRRTLGTVRLELVIGGGLWSVRADPNQLENALLNLALNARDAMAGQGDGRLTIEATNASLDDAYAARVAEVTPGQYVMFAVTDTGCGMVADQLARATEPFFTTKPEGQGTGLGLSMVFGFAKQSGGHLGLYSEPGRGTTARLYIPRTTDRARPMTIPAQDTPSSAGELVLLVEDDPAVRQSSADALRALGYAVQDAADADAALSLLEGGLRPDVLFTDVVMPGRLSSRALAETAQAMLPGIAVLFTSGYTQNAIVHNGQLDPGINLLSKPWRTNDLQRALRAALDAARAPSRTARLRVLLVEDEDLVRMTTADMLADAGFDVLEAGTLADALTRLDGQVDILVTDLSLPDGDGLELVARARALRPDLPVVVASGRAHVGEGYVVLAKPYDGVGLRAAVDAALAG